MMQDEEFLTSFEQATLPFDQWNHRAHLRVAFLYAASSTLDEAIDRIRTGIKNYNKATNTPEALDRGYHETMTVAFMRLVYDANRRTGPHSTSEVFCDAHPELLNKYVLRLFYTPAQLMTRWAKTDFVEPDLLPLPPLSTRGTCPALSQNESPAAHEHDDTYLLVEEFSRRQIQQLYNFIRKQWWGGSRTLQDVQQMTAHTSLIERSSGRLVGFCRVLTDFVFRATIYDVMVDTDLQGHGLGSRLMDTISNHPKLQSVSLIYLCCEPDLHPFYARWGFESYTGRATWMLKIQQPE